MERAVGPVLRGCVLACCVLSALSAGTFTEQSSSAWGSVQDGRTVERGTHTSHSSRPLPDQDDLLPDGLGFRGGFGSSRRRRPTGAPQQPVPTPGGVPQQQVPSSWGAPQLPVSNAGGVPQQPVPIPGGANRQAVPSADAGPGVFPTTASGPVVGPGAPQGSVPVPGVGLGVPQGPVPVPSVGPHSPQRPVAIPGAGFDAFQRPMFDANAIHDAYRNLFAQYPNLNINLGTQQPWPVYRQQPAVSFPTGFRQQWAGTPQQQLSPRGGFARGQQPQLRPLGADHAPSPQPLPVSGPDGSLPAAGSNLAGAQQSGSGPMTSAVGAQNPTGVNVLPTSPRITHPLFQAPDVRSIVDALASQAFGNAARGITQGIPHGSTVTGSSSVQRRHHSIPTAGVQSQHASVNSLSFRRAQPLPQVTLPPLPNMGSIAVHPTQAVPRQSPTFQAVGTRHTQFPWGQAPPPPQPADASAPWRSVG